MTKYETLGAWLLGMLAIGCSTSLSGCRSCGARPVAHEKGPGRARVALPAPNPRADNARSPLGTNLEGLTDWSTEIPFADVFKSSRPWISASAGQWDDGRALDLDSHGWVRSLKPGQIARTLMLWEIPAHPGGKYVVRYDGQGKLHYHELSGARQIAAESRPGRDVIDVRHERGAGGILLEIHETQPSNPIRNIRVYLPGGSCRHAAQRSCEADSDCAAETCLRFEDGGPRFNPKFLERTRTYGVLRFMDWMSTNNSAVRSWSERPELEDARWTERGVPAEVMVELANELGAHPWFTFPHRADDDYVRRFAETVRARLKPGLNPWFEYSNEVWNATFSQAKYAEQEGQRLGLGTGLTAGLHFYSRRSLQIFEALERVFGGAGRIRRVVATQAANAWTAETVLEFEGAARKVDALAIAPYFGMLADAENADKLRAMSAEALVRHIRAAIFPEVFGWMRQNARVADRFGVALVAYEGGQHFVAHPGLVNDARLNELFDLLNRRPEMRALYLEYLRAWREAGGTWLVHFVNCGRWTKWGRWGALEWIDQPQQAAPKYDALQSFIRENPRWW
jgi:hypothetical protein